MERWEERRELMGESEHASKANTSADSSSLGTFVNHTRSSDSYRIITPSPLYYFITQAICSDIYFFRRGMIQRFVI